MRATDADLRAALTDEVLLKAQAAYEGQLTIFGSCDAMRDVLVAALTARPEAAPTKCVTCLDCGTICAWGESCPQCGLGDPND